MAKKQMLFKTKGMNRDLSVSAFNPEFSFDNMNLRLSTNENNTLLSWVNEKGTQAIDGTKLSIDPAPWDDSQEKPESPIYGIPIGTAVLNNQLVIFTHNDKDIDYYDKITDNPDSPVKAKDFIYVLCYNKDGDTPIMKGKCIFRGNLGFSTSNPLETIVSYESEFIQKVYWVDGVKQPRVINIAADNEYLKKWNKGEEVIHNSEMTAFNFVMNLKLEETVKIKKVTGGNGQFPAGVIQYAFTYYNKNGQESAIFYTSPLLYVSPKERGAAQDEKVDNIFQIKVSNVDTNYDYLRIYSLERTTLNAVPIAKRVQDIKIDPERESSEYTFTDTGYSGDSIDPTELLYKGGEFVIAKTMEQKDGTLFLGNLTMERESIENTLKEDIVNAVHIEDGMRAIYTNEYSFAAYKYYSQLTAYDSGNKDNSVPCGGFKRGDYYRLGVQFQHVSGKWSDPVCCEHHKKCGYGPVGEEIVNLPTFEGILSRDVASTLYNKGYRKIRPVVVFPKIYDRVAVCQGVVCPTLYTDNQRADSDMIGQSSWFFRPALQRYNPNTQNQEAYNPIDAEADVEPRGLIATSNTLPVSEISLYYTYNGMGNFDRHAYKEDTEDTFVPIQDNYHLGAYNTAFIKAVEIQGEFALGDKFNVSRNVFTLHSPDFEFDEAINNLSFENLICKQVGGVGVTKTSSDINIQTSSPAIDNDSNDGFIRHTISKAGNNGIVSGLFYQDKQVDDNGGGLEAYGSVGGASMWMVYLWNKSGSLNNDINRPSDKGTSSAVLKKKLISNLRFCETLYLEDKNVSEKVLEDTPVVFNSNEVSIIRLGAKNYQGNIDTTLMSNEREGHYFANMGDINYSLIGNKPDSIKATPATFFKSPVEWKTFGFGNSGSDNHGLYKYRRVNISSDPSNPQYLTAWIGELFAIGDDYADLVTKKDSVRMRYKSTPHLVFNIEDYANNLLRWYHHQMPIVDLCRNDNTDFIDNLFGGTSEDAMKENVWVPCGEPIRLDEFKTLSAHWYKSGKAIVYGGYTDEDAQTLDNDNPETSYSGITEAEEDGWVWVDTINGIQFQYSYGDTYFQRWDCLKTYPFSSEDVNQVVEIGSFMLESHVNADGRYDRNRGMTSNLYMTPQNFNRFNPVYSQVDNFFSYRIQDEDFYKDKNFPNQLTWSKTKTSGADVDLWTNITLASVLELDGDKGEIQKLIRLNDQLLAFQDTGISQVLYNDNVQISSTDGVPIEIANSGKVSGKRYLSNTIGCANKWSMTNTPNGIYFMDSINKDIFMFNGQLNNLSQQYGFNTWAKDNIIGVGEGTEWNPKDFKNFVTYYDKLNQDVLFINSEKALAWSERLGTFTSFYDYGETPFFCNLEDTGVWLKPVEVENPSSHWECSIWRHQTGDYCNFFGNNKPYWMTLVGNPEPQTDKVFTNLEFRACVDGDGTPSTSKDEDGNPVKFTPSTPFDSVETWNEYQHGYTALSIKNGHSMFQHGGSDSALIRKFRIWRCDIPRNNCNLGTPAEGVTWPYSTDAQLGVSRYVRKPQDRMRNPWLYIKLYKAEAGYRDALRRSEIHDVVMTYFT